MLSESHEEVHLFIFEGDADEPKLFDNLEIKFPLNGISIKTVFGGNIYHLFKNLNDDNYLDILTLIKQRNPKNENNLKDIDPEDISAIYLFFDYDAHTKNASDIEVEDLLKFFNDETNHGLLYISYPMIEAFRHYNDYESFKDLIVKCKRSNCPHINECENYEPCLKEPHYKNVVHNVTDDKWKNIPAYTLEMWKELIYAHLSKMNFIMKDNYKFPDSSYKQLDIFLNQFQKYINQDCPQVAVLSPFPIYLLDYFGAKTLKEKLKII